jgi:hypothetical protein
MSRSRNYRRLVSIARKLFLLTALLAPVVCAEAADSQQPLPTTKTFEALVSKWVNLRRQITVEEQSWKEQKAHLERERELLVKERELLEKEIAEKENLQASQEKERTELVHKKQAYQKSLDDTLSALSAAEADLRRWRRRIPSSLLSASEKQFDKLERTSKQSVSQRLQLILSLYAEVERLQYGVHVVKEVLHTDSAREREFDVIYLGLAQGYCVSSDGKLAGIGRPAKEGWVWRWRPAIASEVQKGIEYYKHERIADFVHLPLKVIK